MPDGTATLHDFAHDFWRRYGSRLPEDGREALCKLHTLTEELIAEGLHASALDLLKGAVASHEPAKADEERAWDADAAISRLRERASSDGSGEQDTIDWSSYREGFAWYDGDASEEFGSYKLPHHDVLDGTFVVVLKGVQAAGGAIQGARGGVDIPDGDLDGVKSHLRAHYAQWEDQEAPFDKREKRLTVHSDGSWELFAPIIKQDAERHVITGHALAANVVDYQDDYVRPDQIWKAMEEYMVAFQEVGVMHQTVNPLLKVVECYQAPLSFELASQSVGLGDWLLSVKVLDDPVWGRVEAGELRGFSIGGKARRVKRESLPDDVIRLA